MAQGRKAGMLPYGNGCELYPDCFTCPCPEVKGCVWQYGANKEKRQMLLDLWKPYFERELIRAEALGGKG